MSAYSPSSSPSPIFAAESLRLEAVTCCVGFDDILDETLRDNMPNLDTMIVITSHEDRLTHKVVNKHGATLVLTDLFKKNGRGFNKGAAINQGMGYFQYRGWRVHLDADIALPANARRMLFNRTYLDEACIYGIDRIDVIGLEELARVRDTPQHLYGSHVRINGPIGHRFICPLNGYAPIGFFQLWHSSCQRNYPYSLGTAAHDDTLFSTQWKAENRRHIPTFVCHHILAAPSRHGENWDGKRSQPRLKKP